VKKYHVFHSGAIVHCKNQQKPCGSFGKQRVNPFLAAFAIQHEEILWCNMKQNIKKQVKAFFAVGPY